MKESTPHSIAQNIKKYRLLNNMTQEELARQLYLDTQYYAQLERGERNFTIEKIINVCSLFHIGVEDIIELPSSEEADTSRLQEDIIAQLRELSQPQLLLLQKFMSEIITYCR